jgi:MFS family permease
MTPSAPSENAPGSLPVSPEQSLPWYRGLTKYHWFVLVVCWMAWFFDTMDQQLFIIAREPVMMDLLGRQDVKFLSGIVTMIMMLGWATGGIVFGILGDRWGRAKTMVLAIMFYSIFTGFSALSVTWIDFAIYRFLTGLGVGGTFGAAVSFVAEVMPARSRPYALGFLQSLAAIGNMTAACISFVLQPRVTIFGMAGWRPLFVVGILPAILVLLVMRRIKEPESWVRAKEAEAQGRAQHKGKGMGSTRELFGDKRWRRNVIVGIILGLAGIIGLWSIGFWLPELVREVVPGGTPTEKANQDNYVSMAMLLFNGAAAVGTYLFAALMARVGRRPAFALIFVLALASVIGVFGFMRHQGQVWWMAPLLGLGTLTIFGGYSIYFPELFPTRLRATGVGFCYNTARYLAAMAPLTLGALASTYKGWDITALSSLGGVDSGFRYAALTVACVFVVGLLVLPFAPETKGKPLPE